MTLTPSHHPEPVDVSGGEATDCATDCDLTDCVICGERVCPEHDDGVEACVVLNEWHHKDLECSRFCRDCDQAAYESHQEWLADCWREGAWDD